MRKMYMFAAALGFIISVASSPSFAAGSSSGYGETTSSTSKIMKKVNKSLENGNYANAYKMLSKEAKSSPKDADIHNLLGFSARKMGNYSASEAHYTRALDLDPEHKGALEYMGELYLTLNQLDKAEALQARLDDVCWLGCDELDTLNAAIADWKSKNG